MAGPGEADQGATPRERVLEASRRNQVHLLRDVIADITRSAPASAAKERIADVLNQATDGLGRHCLHLAATYGSYDVMDMILDQEGVEVDPRDRIDRDTPLHQAVRFVNGRIREEWEEAKALPELLLDAGADPRIRNKAKLRPVDLVDPANDGLRMALRKAEYAIMAGDDIVDDDAHAAEDAGSASDPE